MGRRCRAAMLAAAGSAALAGGTPAEACPAPPDLDALAAGRSVDVRWTATLDPGEAIVLYRGLLSDLSAAAFGPEVLAPGLPAAGQVTDAEMPPAEDGYFYVARCEGPGGNGEWSNMAFKMVRNLATVVDASGRDYPNLYHVSTPARAGFEDTASSAAPEANKCVGDPDGPAAGDGIINADDLICAWWTARAPCCGQGILVSTYDNDPGPTAWRSRGAFFHEADACSPAGWHFLGAWTDPLVRDQAYQVQLVRGTAPPSRSLALIAGAHDPAAACQDVRYVAGPPGTLNRHLLNVPYHSAYRTADEILCGRPVPYDPTGWEDVVGTEGEPDTCPNGIFDATAADTYFAQIITFDNVDDGSGPRLDGADTDGTVVIRVATRSVFGYLDFTATDFRVLPGQAYLVDVSSRHGATTLCPRVHCAPPEATCR